MGKKKGKKGKKEPDLVAIQAAFTEKLLMASFAPVEENARAQVQELLTNEVPKIVEAGAKQNQVLLVSQLLDNRNVHGRSAVQFAAVRGHLEVIALLVTGGADIDLGCEFGQTPLHLASFLGHHEVVGMLIDLGASVDVTDTAAETALHIAACQGHGSVSERLISAGTPVDAQNRDGRTALHLAVLSGNANVAEKLVRASADVTITDLDGVQADSMAQKMAQPGIETMIRTHAIMKQSQRKIRYLQAQSRGPNFMDRSYVVLPPLVPDDGAAAEMAVSGIVSEAPVVAGIII